MTPPQLVDLCASAYLRELAVSTELGWSAHNPSIAHGPFGYCCIVRSANYVYRNGNFVCTSPDQMVRTTNYFCTMDDDLNVVSMTPIDESWVRRPILFPWVQNVEDYRLYWDGGWRAIGTIREHREDGLPQMARDRLGVLDDGTVYVTERSIMRHTENTCEKNWVPIGSTDTFLYSAHPTRYVLPDGTMSEPTENPRADFPNTLRGGSQLLPCKGGWLAVTHEVTWQPTRHYWHRFVRYNHDLHLVAWSEPFFFLSPGTEFAAGLTWWDGNYVVSFGNNEERALLAIVPTHEVDVLIR